MFCRPVVTAPAFVRRDGAVLADAWLPDRVRLGELKAHLGDGVIEDLVVKALAEGRLPRPARRRIMSYPLVIRLMIAMGLMPGASYCEALSRLAGLLAGVPFTRDWHVPTEKVITGWRMPVPPSLMEALFWQAAGLLIGDGAQSAVTLAGMPAVRGRRDAGEPGGHAGGAGNRTSGPVLRPGRPRLVISEAWAWLTGTQLTRASAAAALEGRHAAARALRGKHARAVTADEDSFTAAWRHAARSMITTQVTALVARCDRRRGRVRRP